MMHSGIILSMAFKTLKSEKKSPLPEYLWEYLHVSLASCNQEAYMHIIPLLREGGLGVLPQKIFTISHPNRAFWSNFHLSMEELIKGH